MTSFAPEFGVKYTLTGPDGTIATFNDPTDANDVGALTDLSGLDSAEVRESGDVFVGFDGGVQGPNYYGRRPIVLEGVVYGHSTISARNDKLARLMRASNAMRGDATLSWTPTGFASPMTVTVRRQQPLRISGAWNKTFQVPLVAADPRIYGPVQQAAAESVLGASVSVAGVVNSGNDYTYPIFRIGGQFTAPFVITTTDTNAEDVVFASNIAANEIVYVDMLKRTVRKGTRRIRRNYFPTPSFEGATAALTASASTTFAPNVAMPATSSGFGSKVATITSTSSAVSTIGAATAIMTGNVVTDAAVSPATHDLFTVGWSALAATTARRMLIGIEWINSAGTVIGTDGALSTAGDITSAWRRQVASFARPSTLAVKVRVTFSFVTASGNFVSGEVHYMDGVTIESGFGDFAWADGTPLGTYFDGSSTDTVDTVHTWDGTVGNSVSTEAGTAALEDLYPLYEHVKGNNYSMLDHTLTSWFGLAPGSHTIVVDGAAATGAQAALVEWRSAWV